MFRKVIILSLLPLVLAGCSNCNKAVYDGTPKKNIVSPQLLTGVGLEMVWQNDLPFKMGESADQIFICGRNAVVITSTNTLICVDRFKGNIRFTKELAPKRLPISKPVFEGDTIHFLVGKELMSLNLETAEFNTTLVAPVYPSAMPAFNSSYYYVAGIDKKVICFDREECLPVFKVSSCTGSPIKSIAVNDDNLFIITEAGNVFSTSSSSAHRNWRFDLGGNVDAEACLDGASLYLSSLDSNMYKLHSFSGTLSWKVPLGDEIKDSPVVMGELVFVKAGKQGLYALNTETGETVWQEVIGEQIISADGENVYVFTDNKLISLMDNKAGKSKFRINAANVDKAAVNTVDSNMYVISKSGSLALIRPIEK